MSRCEFAISNTSCNINDADNYATAESSSSLLEATIPSQVLKNFVLPKSKVLNICTRHPKTKEFIVPTRTKHTVLPTKSYRVGVNKPKHARPPFLYEQYPLKPALLYDRPLSFVRDPLNRLDHMAYLPQSSVHSNTSLLPTSQSVAVHTQYIPPEHSIKKQKSRLISGEDGCRYVEIANAAWKTKEALATIDSLEGICMTCHRKGFSVPQSALTNGPVENTTTHETNDSETLTEIYSTARENIIDSLVYDNEKQLDEKESLFFYNPCYHYGGESRLETPLEQAFSSNNSRMAMSLNSYEPDYVDSLPMFEVLPRNNIEDYTYRSALKHKDSLLLYEKLKPKTFKPPRFITFFDEAQLASTSSDEDIIFGSGRGLNYKLQCWEESRIGWLSELERRNDVYRRRQKRAELRQLKQPSQSAKSRSRQYSFWCRRLRSWLPKWNI